MTFSWFKISWCKPISECKDLSKLRYLGKKWIKKGTYEYIYWDGEPFNGIYYRSKEYIEIKKDIKKDDNEIELYSPYYNCMC